MSDTTVGLCRITIRAPESVFELGIPVDVPLVELMPVLLDYAGDGLDELALEHGGWVLQRLGAPPLDGELTARALELRDGDTLHLRPRNETLPEAAFDDLVDGVGEVLRSRPDSWRPELTRRLLLGLTVSALAGGLVTLLLPGPSALLRAGACAALALLLLACAGIASRAVGDAAGGAALAAVAVPCLGVAGALVPTEGGPEALLGARLLAGGATATGATVLGLAAVAACVPLFLGAFTVTLLTAVTGGLVLAGLDLPAAACVVALAAVVVGGLAPGLSFRLAGLRLPLPPATSEDLQDDIEPHEPRRVTLRAVTASNYLTGLYTGLGVVLAAAVTALATGPATDDWPEPVFAAALSVLLLLHVRSVGSLWQRLAMLLPGAYGLLLGACVTAAGAGPAGRLGMTVGLVAAAAVAAVAAWTVPGRRLVPYWGRAGDLLHTGVAIALIPLALAATGVYHLIRGISG
ncbi:type VII secretion integral membrane protein EccD [Streptomyces albus]|uniref:type VII secretion integral membrane protein EccD n=1 Tax=Streptomyces albus TaxID=1888 RepID=UPI0036F966EC